MLNFNKTLIIAAHPDDEVLGCGGVIAKLIKDNQQVRVIFIAEGTTCRYESITKQAQQEIEYRNKCSVKAMNTLGVSDFIFYNHPCGRLGDEPILELAKIIEKEIKVYAPTTILTHHKNDVHNDHKIVYQAVLQATRPVGHIVKNLLSFEILSSTEWNYSSPFKPNFFVDISSQINQKLDAMNCYDTEQPEAPHPRSVNVIKSLATFRGSQSACQYAEAFEIIRIFNS